MMETTGEDTGIRLLLEEDIVEVPEVQAEIFLSQQEVPEGEEVLLMHKILQAMGLGFGMTRFRYFSAWEEVKTMRTAGLMTIAFRQNSSVDGTMEIEDTGNSPFLGLPSLRQISGEDSVKREVWRSIKPFSVR